MPLLPGAWGCLGLNLCCIPPLIWRMETLSCPSWGAQVLSGSPQNAGKGCLLIVLGPHARMIAAMTTAVLYSHNGKSLLQTCNTTTMSQWSVYPCLFQTEATVHRSRNSKEYKTVVVFNLEFVGQTTNDQIVTSRYMSKQRKKGERQVYRLGNLEITKDGKSRISSVLTLGFLMYLPPVTRKIRKPNQWMTVEGGGCLLTPFYSKQCYKLPHTKEAPVCSYLYFSVLWGRFEWVSKGMRASCEKEFMNAHFVCLGAA